MGTQACTHARLLGVIKQFAKTSIQSVAFCPSAGHHPTRGWADTKTEASSSATAQHKEEMSSGHGFRITETDRLSPSVPTFADFKQLSISWSDKTRPRAW